MLPETVRTALKTLVKAVQTLWFVGVVWLCWPLAKNVFFAPRNWVFAKYAGGWWSVSKLTWLGFASGWLLQVVVVSLVLWLAYELRQP